MSCDAGILTQTECLDIFASLVGGEDEVGSGTDPDEFAGGF